MKELKGKTALVTGASSGIGMALAKSLAARGSHLIITARSEDKLNALANELRQKGITVHVFAEDLSEAGAAKRLYEQVIGANLKVDLLINNAGYGKWGEFLSETTETYANMLQLNINALTELCHLFIPAMLERGEGGIINVGSTASFVPVPYAAVYSASKAYVIMFTEALQGEYGDRGLQAMTLCPGGTASNFASVASSEYDFQNNTDTPEFVAETGIQAFLDGKLAVITGRNNQIAGILPRFLPRRTVMNMVGNTFKQRIGM